MDKNDFVIFNLICVKIFKTKNVVVGPSMGFDVWQILHNSMVTRFISVSHPTLTVKSWTLHVDDKF